MKKLSVFAALLFIACGARPGFAAEQLDLAVSKWLAAQANVHSWSADFTQTRTFKSLTQPLTATGHVWFGEPNRFRWELGHPPQTIALRAPTELLVVYPRLKRIEHFPLSGSQSGQWQGALALLEAGFPRNKEQLLNQYNVLGQSPNASSCELTLQPKSSGARKMMPQFKITFDTTNNSLLATELQFADGSTLRNDFRNVETNPSMDEKLFAPDFPADYKNVEPMKGAK